MSGAFQTYARQVSQPWQQQPAAPATTTYDNVFPVAGSSRLPLDGPAEVGYEDDADDYSDLPGIGYDQTVGDVEMDEFPTGATHAEDLSPEALAAVDAAMRGEEPPDIHARPAPIRDEVPPHAGTVYNSLGLEYEYGDESDLETDPFASSRSHSPQDRSYGSDTRDVPSTFQADRPGVAGLASAAHAANDDEPLYVNAKQYHRILKRRAARARLEEMGRLSRERKVRFRLHLRLHLPEPLLTLCCSLTCTNRDTSTLCADREVQEAASSPRRVPFLAFQGPHLDSSSRAQDEIAEMDARGLSAPSADMIARMKAEAAEAKKRKRGSDD